MVKLQLSNNFKIFEFFSDNSIFFYVNGQNILIRFNDFIFLADYSLASPEQQIVNSQLQSVTASTALLDLFNELAKSVPYDEFKNFIKNADEAGESAQQIKPLLDDAVNAYFASSQSVYEWCGAAVERLQSYLRLLENFSIGKAKLQQRIVISVLENALQKFSLAQDKLEAAAYSFSKTVERIGDSQFDELKQSIENANAKIGETRTKLKDEIRALGDIKTQAQVNLDTINDITEIDEFGILIKNEIPVPVNKLIEECRKYRQLHQSYK